MERLTLGRMQNPIRGFLHGGAAFASVIGLIVLLIASQGYSAAIVSSLIFGAALILMFSTSSLYHSIPWSEQWKVRMQRLDHTMIFFVVAGTFTPIAVASLTGGQLALAVSTVWGLTMVGVALKAILSRPAAWLSVTIQMLMGWSALIWMPAIYRQLGLAAIALIAVGGLCYTVGVVIWVRKRPLLFPRSFSYHELFHVLVIAASALHFLAVYLYAIPTIAA
ncbi:MAG: hemolysin III family protein [Acidimicrobiia bacterium]|nr:hemolysin III family protein [Acidimicrobiia bacterium]MDH3463308.1 hemolysin III family protein [Acidimicrobiia bacterium]